LIPRIIPDGSALFKGKKMKNRLFAALTAVFLFLQPALSLAGSFSGKDATGATKNWKAGGDGSSGTPYIPHHILTDGTSTAGFDTAGTDAGSNTASRLAISSWLYGFNGTTWDRVRTGLTAATSTPIGFLNSLPFGKYNATPPTLTDGQSINMQLDVAGNLKVNPGTVPVTGAFWQTTQPVSLASVPLPTGAATSAKQDTGNTSLSSIDSKITAVNTGAVTISSSVLPTGAATSAKQPALGTAGTASSDVLTVQGIASMTALKMDGSAVTQPVSGTFWQATQPVSGTVTVQQSTAANLKVDLSGTAANATALKVDGSAVTQPVSGTFWQATQPVSGTVTANAIQSGTWTVQPGNTANTTAWKVDGSAVTQPVSGTLTANIGTSGSLALDATLTGGTQKSIVRGGAKGSTAAADVTSTASGSNHQPIDVVIYDTSGNAITSFGGSGGTSSSFGSAFPSTGTAVGASDGTNMQGLQVESSSNKNLKVALYNGANEASVSAGGAVKVDGSAATQPVSGTFWQATQPVSGTVTANAGTGTFGTNLAQVGGSSVALGQTTMSASVPVAIASNQSDLPNKTAYATATTGTFTNGTQTTSITNSSVSGYPTVTVSINGTYGTATAVFEASDDAGTTWYSVDSTRTDSNTIETGYTSLTNTSRMWVIPIQGANQFRVRSTAVASGTANVRITPTGSITADATVVSIGSALPTGANVIGALSANQSTNIAQLAGTTTDTNSGNKSAGTLRVVLATDQPALTNKLLVTPDANSAINVAQINGVTPLMGNGVTGTGSPRVTIASDNTAFSVNAAITAASGTVVSGSIADGAVVTLGAKADAKSTATDTTAVTAMQVLKQISASVQAPPSQAVTNAGTFAVQAADAGDVASGSSDSGNPVKQGYLGKTALPTAVSDGQRVNGIADKFGRQVVVQETVRDLRAMQNTTITSSTSETTIVTAAGAGVFADIASIVISNSSTTATTVTIKDSTAGTTQAILDIPANGGIVWTPPFPLPQGTANNNWTATCGTSVASIHVTVLYAKNK
jgi:hypothetical protein